MFAGLKSVNSVNLDNSTWKNHQSSGYCYHELGDFVNSSVGRLNFSRYDPSDLASPDRSWIFFYDCHEEYYLCNIFPGCYVLDNGDSCSRLPSNIDQAARLHFPDILMFVLLPMVIDYFNGCTRTRSLDIAVQINIMREPSLKFSDQWFGLIWLPSKKYKIMSWKKKEFEYLKYLLISFRLCFIIIGDSLCISIIYYLFL
jgi:hypothetical protein